MERIIIFRGKRVDTGELVYGDLLHGVNHKAGKIFILPIKGGVMGLGRGEDPLDGYEVVPESVGQNTGLKDKNGVEIFERDICKWPSGHLSEIVWNTARACFTAAAITQPKGVGRAAIVATYIEVIGNRFEHPELLNS